jgi:hypothetical protein
MGDDLGDLAEFVNASIPLEGPATVSGDGKFEWNGKQWVPIRESPSPAEPKQQQRPDNSIAERSQSRPAPRWLVWLVARLPGG